MAKKRAAKPAELVTADDALIHAREALGSAPSSVGYNEVVSRASLQRLMLVASEFHMDPGMLKPSADIRLSFDLSDVHEFKFSEESGLAIANFDWTQEAESSSKSLFKLTAKYVVFYGGLEGLSEPAVKAFVIRFGTFATYPYFRSLAAQMSWASSANLPALPILQD